MRINYIKYQNKAEEWGYDKISFFDLTLLVGLSGVGKTQILKSIENLQSLIFGASNSEIKWEFSFQNEGNDYLWKGETEYLSIEKSFNFTQESLTINNKVVTERKGNQVVYQGTKMPKLASDESLIVIFKEENLVKPAFSGFENITFRDHTRKPTYGWGFALDIVLGMDNIEDVRSSGFDPLVKMYFVQERVPSFFKKIKEAFLDIFDQTVDLKIDFVGNKDTNDTVVFWIKEKGVKEWIPQKRISSGMLRTLYHICEMYLLPKGSVVLIDEFENSLGVNCLDLLTEDLLFENNKIQFIATSHHPYIINKIPYEYWKIVTRKNGQIKTYDAKEFNLGDSNHERFLSLINLREYKEGIQS